jgi:hypothetical protein
MTQSTVAFNRSLVQQGVAAFHYALRNHPQYQARFRSRVGLHIQTLNNGVFGKNWDDTHRAAVSFQSSANGFANLIYGETTRWANLRKTPGYKKSDPAYLTGQTFGDWDRNTGYLINSWIPARRGYFIQHLQAVGLAN